MQSNDPRQLKLSCCDPHMGPGSPQDYSSRRTDQKCAVQTNSACRRALDALLAEMHTVEKPPQLGVLKRIAQRKRRENTQSAHDHIVEARWARITWLMRARAAVRRDLAPCRWLGPRSRSLRALCGSRCPGRQREMPASSSWHKRHRTGMS